MNEKLLRWLEKRVHSPNGYVFFAQIIININYNWICAKKSVRCAVRMLFVAFAVKMNSTATTTATETTTNKYWFRKWNEKGVQIDNNRWKKLPNHNNNNNNNNRFEWETTRRRYGLNWIEYLKWCRLSSTGTLNSVVCTLSGTVERNASKEELITTIWIQSHQYRRNIHRT